VMTLLAKHPVTGVARNHNILGGIDHALTGPVQQKAQRHNPLRLSKTSILQLLSSLCQKCAG